MRPTACLNVDNQTSAFISTVISLKESERLTGLHMEEWFVYVMWVQPLENVWGLWSNPLTPPPFMSVSKTSWTSPRSGRDWNTCQTSHHHWIPSFPFTSSNSLPQNLIQWLLSFSFVSVPSSCTLKLHFTYYLILPFYTIAPHFPLPFLHCNTSTVKCHCFTECFFRSLYWYEMYLYGKIYICNMYACYGPNRLTHIYFFVNEKVYEFDWVTANSI